MAAASLLLPKHRYHVRSTSMPSRSHPLAIRLHDHLYKLQAAAACNWDQASFPSSQATTQMLLNALGGLRVVYDCVEDLLRCPLIQQALTANRHQLFVDEMLDGSLRLLDLCETARYVFKSLKENTQELMSALRRRKGRLTAAGGDLELQQQAQGYMSLRNKMHKDMSRCLSKALKREESKFAFSPLAAVGKLDQHNNIMVLISVLKEVRSTTISIFEPVALFVSLPSAKSKKVGRSLISKWMGQVADHRDEMFEMDMYGLFGNGNKPCKDIGVHVLENVQKRLKAMDDNLQSLENELDCVFRRLIKTRVSLLNILNH
ncbi:hypothetical protein ACLOJK_002332 [Asimina triloba]